MAPFVRGRSDAQLERLVGSDPALGVIFKGMERSFVPEKANGFSGEVQYELTTSNGPKHGSADRIWAACRNRAGHRAEPGSHLSDVGPMFARIASQEVHPAKAMMEGGLQVTGDFDAAARLGEMFGQD